MAWLPQVLVAKGMGQARGESNVEVRKNTRT
jgi:hypothetical protein